MTKSISFRAVVCLALTARHHAEIPCVGFLKALEAMNPLRNKRLPAPQGDDQLQKTRRRDEAAFGAALATDDFHRWLFEPALSPGCVHADKLDKDGGQVKRGAASAR